TKDVNLYWTLTNATTAATSYTPTFTYNAGDIIGGGNQSAFILGRYNAGWSASIAATNAGTGPYTTATASGQTAYGDYVVGETNASPVLGATAISPAFTNQCTNQST